MWILSCLLVTRFHSKIQVLLYFLFLNLVWNAQNFYFTFALGFRLLKNKAVKASLEKDEKDQGKVLEGQRFAFFPLWSLVQFSKCNSGLPEITQLSVHALSEQMSVRSSGSTGRGELSTPSQLAVRVTRCCLCWEQQLHLRNARSMDWDKAPWLLRKDWHFFIAEKLSTEASSLSVPYDLKTKCLKESFFLGGFLDSHTWNLSIQRAVFPNSPDSWQTCTQKGEKWKSGWGRRSETHSFNPAAVSLQWVILGF